MKPQDTTIIEMIDGFVCTTTKTYQTVEDYNANRDVWVAQKTDAEAQLAELPEFNNN